MTHSLFSFIPSDFLETASRERKWIETSIQSIGSERIHKLVAAAKKVRLNAYPPYSKYYVGAAVLSVSGNIYASCNAEAVSWSDSDHAEQSAVTKAISEGEFKKHGRKFIQAVAVVHPGDSGPCGHCRQVIAEHADNALIIVARPSGEIWTITSLKLLLPLAFTPSDLGK
jgi:cytidine deaminase